jgi:hypothetical protein
MKKEMFKEKRNKIYKFKHLKKQIIDIYDYLITL